MLVVPELATELDILQQHQACSLAHLPSCTFAILHICQACIDLQNTLMLRRERFKVHTATQVVFESACSWPVFSVECVQSLCAKLMSTVVGNDRSWLAAVIAWLGLCQTACFQLVAASSGTSNLVAACDTAVLSATGIQHWQAMFLLLCTLFFIVAASAFLNAVNSILLQLDSRFSLM